MTQPHLRHWRHSPRLSRRQALLACGLGLGLGLGSLGVPLRAQGAAPVWADWPVLGGSLFRYFGLAIYRAELRVAPGFVPERYAEHPLALSLAYQRSLRGRAIAERSLEEMQGVAERSGRALDAQAAPVWLAAMENLFPDVRAGDVLVGQHQPGRGARFFFNGKALGEVADAEFSARFFGIWLDPKTSQPALRTALLGRT